MRRALKRQGPALIAVVALAIGSLGILGYILSQQRFYLPAWVPVLGTDFYELDAEFSTGQAVVPGQGQAVTIAGVKVGEVGDVRLEDGKAVVHMLIQEDYGPVYRDATVLLRPKSLLKDMFLALDRGTPASGELPDGAQVELANTLPDVNTDEVLSALDGDTRDYLTVLIGAGGTAFDDGQAELAGSAASTSASEQTASQDLRETLKRVEPSARFGKRFTALLAERRRNIRHAIHNFQELSTALASKDRQLARLVDSANVNFETLAGEEAGLREGLRLLPATLSQTERALAGATGFANELGPALARLRPLARDLGPALQSARPFLTESTPIIRDQIRPFARDVQPVVRDLRSASEDLSVVTPRLTKTLEVLNPLFNAVAYDPPGSADSSLFWGGWAAHAGTNILSLQDAHGPVARGLPLTWCDAYDIFERIINNAEGPYPHLGMLLQLTNLPDERQACPNNQPDDDPP